jgi:hypothetical protein
VEGVIGYLNKPTQRHIFHALYNDMPLRMEKVIEAHVDPIDR